MGFSNRTNISSVAFLANPKQFIESHIFPFLLRGTKLYDEMMGINIKLQMK